ncbi:MAG: response regulator, partial [Thermoanaerobaculia bacterium]
MPETILAVEYEPRYIERIRQALSALPFAVVFAKDGAEALGVLSSPQAAPRLIVLSSVIPKMSTLDLIREIRGRDAFKETPILLTVSGYTGKSPVADAQRIGASDLLAKPYAEPDLLAKVQQVLGIAQAAPVPSEADPHQFTSNEIFGDIIDGEPAAAQGRKLSARAEASLDKMLADTLADVMPGKKGAPQ